VNRQRVSIREFLEKELLIHVEESPERLFAHFYLVLFWIAERRPQVGKRDTIDLRVGEAVEVACLEAAQVGLIWLGAHLAN
jgi:hypothetical protein